MKNNGESNFTFLKKIKDFITSLFNKNKQSEKLISEKSSLTLKEEELKNLKRESYIIELAEKLFYGEIGPTDVEDEYLDELINYFKSDIQTTKSRIEKCKERIQKMRLNMIEKNS